MGLLDNVLGSGVPGGRMAKPLGIALLALLASRMGQGGGGGGGLLGGGSTGGGFGGVLGGGGLGRVVGGVLGGGAHLAPSVGEGHRQHQAGGVCGGARRRA